VTTPIAERRLFFSDKGQLERKRLVIRIYALRPVEADSVTFRVDGDTAICVVEFEGLPDVALEKIYGADSLQALQLAVDVEPVLKRLSKQYDLYFPSGEGYFDD
jgi:hypothetical protein